MSLLPTPACFSVVIVEALTQWLVYLLARPDSLLMRGKSRTTNRHTVIPPAKKSWLKVLVSPLEKKTLRLNLNVLCILLDWLLDIHLPLVGCTYVCLFLQLCCPSPHDCYHVHYMAVWHIILNPQYVDHFSSKPRIMSTFGFSNREYCLNCCLGFFHSKGTCYAAQFFFDVLKICLKLWNAIFYYGDPTYPCLFSMEFTEEKEIGL